MFGSSAIPKWMTELFLPSFRLSERQPGECEQRVVPRRTPAGPVVVRLPAVEVGVRGVLESQPRVLPRVQVDFPDEPVGLGAAVGAAIHGVGRVQPSVGGALGIEVPAAYTDP